MANPEERVPIDSARVASTYPDKQALMNSRVKIVFLCCRERIYAGTRYNTPVRTSTSFILRRRVTEIYVLLLPRSL